MQNRMLVTGANGHIGNNLVRELLHRNEKVIAGVRDPSNARALDGLNCPVTCVDLLDRESLASRMQGIDVLFQVGAVFRNWARHPEREIYAANLEGTRNVLEAAAEAKVRRIVYVSSLAALDRSVLPIIETGWNGNTDNVYMRSKAHAEQLAWTLARQHGLDMVTVLPGATVGANCFNMTPTMGLLKTILDGELTLNPGFCFNFVDVGDVVDGMLAAAARGRSGQRYLLANENWMGINELARMAQQEFPERAIRMPKQPPRSVLWMLALLMEGAGWLRGKEPLLRRNYLTEFTVRERCDISKARRELGYRPKSPRQAVLGALRWLDGQPEPESVLAEQAMSA
jgi:dihydroflavonol-4-reductase